MHPNSPQLDAADLHQRIIDNIANYEGKSSFECFAIILGKAQILEFGLKSLLTRTCSIKQDEMERWTLGTVAYELGKRKFRADYVALLKEFVKHRNYMAHEMLVNNALFRSLVPDISERFEFKQLQHPAYELEQLLIVHDWCEEQHAWGLPELPPNLSPKD